MVVEHMHFLAFVIAIMILIQRLCWATTGAGLVSGGVSLSENIQ